MTGNGQSRVFVGVNRFKYIGPPPDGAGRGPQLRGVFRLDPRNGGGWTHLAQGLPENGDINALAIDPRDRAVILAGAEDGVYRSTDGGERWERTDFPARDRAIWSILFHPAEPNVVYAGTAPIGVFRSDDGGAHWRRLPDPAVAERVEINFPHRVMKLAINPAAPDEIFAVMEVNGVMRSRDRGETWEDCNDGLVRLADEPHLKNAQISKRAFEGMLDGHAIAASRAAPGKVIVALRMGLFESDDEGAAWRDMELGRWAHIHYSRDICVSPHDPNVLLAGVGVSVKNDNGAIYRSGDLGKSWKRFDAGIDVKSSIMNVACDPANPDRVWGVGRFGQVIGTEDGGRSWADHPLPADCGGGFAIACA
jgi:photosystem II stability/assembly factor-like uncharacterized protein